MTLTAVTENRAHLCVCPLSDAPTSATRLPTNRLNRVDLPTLGRPTMASVGTGMTRALPAWGRVVNLGGSIG